MKNKIKSIIIGKSTSIPAQAVVEVKTELGELCLWELKGF